MFAIESSIEIYKQNQQVETHTLVGPRRSLHSALSGDALSCMAGNVVTPHVMSMHVIAGPDDRCARPDGSPPFHDLFRHIEPPYGHFVTDWNRLTRGDPQVVRADDFARRDVPARDGDIVCPV